MGLKPRAQTPRIEISEETEFLNVDLDLAGSEGLGPLVAALGPVDTIHSTDAPPFCILELGDVGLDFEATMSGFLDVIEKLDGVGRAAWNKCSVRCFNIGIQSGLGPNSTIYSLPAPLLARVASVGAEIVITVYGTRRNRG